MEDFFGNHEIEEELRRDCAFQSVVSIREAVSIARKVSQPITYEHALDLIYDLNPTVYEQVTKLLTNKNESETVKYYKEKAEALSTLDNPLTPQELLEKEISEHEDMLENAENKRFLQKKIFELKSALDFFTPRSVSEHKILARDFYLAEHGGKFAEKLYEDDSYKDYRVSNTEILRLRLLHPDKAEAILGVDLIYEIFDLENEQVRFCHLQYKTWNTNVLYLNDERMFDQIEKVEKHLCKSGYCRDHNGEKFPPGYRLPYCCGFLRPTSKLINNESKLVSTGMHIPVCEVRKIKEMEGKITKQNIISKSISSKNFEDLFNENLLGSRWISFDELDRFYEEKQINSLTNTIRIHAQEIQLKK